MRKHCWLFLAVIGFTGCHFGGSEKAQKPDIFTDTLAYTYQTIHERAADCGEKADSLCTVANIHYPVFKGKSVLNNTITNKLLMMFAMNGKADSSLKLMTGNFMKEYANLSTTDRNKMFFTLDSYAKVVNQDTGLVILEYGGYKFAGGAHGGSFTGFINWDIKKNKNLRLSDLLVANYSDWLTHIAEGVFRKEEKLSDTASLASNYFFDKAKFALNNNFMITPVGLRFIYNEYEIKPYAAGQTELIIPYSQIKKLVRPNAVIAQYIK